MLSILDRFRIVYDRDLSISFYLDFVYRYDKRLLEMFESIAVCKVMNVKEWDETMPYEDEDETPTNLTLIGCSNVTTSNSVDNPPGLYCDLSKRRSPSPRGILDMPVSFWNTYYFPRGESDVMELSRYAGIVHKGGQKPYIARDLPMGWNITYDSRGRRYYYNTDGDARWSHPSLPKGWSEATDMETQRTYYFHRSGAPSQWSFPEGTPAEYVYIRARSARISILLCTHSLVSITQLIT